MAHTHSFPEPHPGNVMSKLNWLRASVLGANDGIISMAALLVGVAGAAGDTHTLLVTGIAGLLAGAISMAAGEYVSVSSQCDTERALLAQEKYELEHYKDKELVELISLYEDKGLRSETAEKVARELTAHDVLQAHADAEFHIDPKNLTSPWQAGFASAISYSTGGIIPMIAILVSGPELRIPVTFIAVFVALIITGLASARVSGAKSVPTITRVVIGGVFAMAITYGIGRLLKVSIS